MGREVDQLEGSLDLSITDLVVPFEPFNSTQVYSLDGIDLS